MRKILKFVTLFLFVGGFGAQFTAAESGELTNVFQYGDPTSFSRFRRFTAKEAKQETKFWLYTRRNPDEPIEIFESGSKSANISVFNPSHPVRIIIHGFLAKRESRINKLVKDAYLKKGDFNVIVVDWGNISGHLYNIFVLKSVYDETAESIIYVGQLVGKFTKFLNQKFKVPFGRMYLIGHSLGAHIAGYAGSTIYPNKYDTIFALDPARPDFESGDPRRMLDVRDASYVESIHTDLSDGLVPGFGLIQRVGRTDFYANFGEVQPGCSMITCSHSRAYEYFAESINSRMGFWARRCSGIDDIIKKDCPSVEPPVTVGGEPSQKNRSGVFYFGTNEQPPFSKPLKSDFVDDVSFRIYSHVNGSRERVVSLSQLYSVAKGVFPLRSSLRIIIGDYDRDADFATDLSKQLKDIYMAKGHFTVIIVDWSKSVQESTYRRDVFADHVGRAIADFTKRVRTRFLIPFKRMVFIGEGVGGQIAGFAGHFIAPYKYNSIFVLDTDRKVMTQGAWYVQGIQANAVRQHGLVTFLFNFKHEILECKSSDCRHQKVCEFFVDSIKKEVNFAGLKCRGVSGVDFGNCRPQNFWINIGERARYKNYRGAYYLFELDIKKLIK